MSGPEQEPRGRWHSAPLQPLDCEWCGAKGVDPCSPDCLSLEVPSVDAEEDAPVVCPGCHAVAEPCKPGCIDAEIERALEEGELDEDYADDFDGFTADEQRAIVEGFEAEERTRAGDEQSSEDLPW